MALTMALTDKSGNVHSAAYYRIISASLNWHTKMSEIVVYGYKDLASRDLNLKPVDEIYVVIEGDEFDELFAPEVISAGMTSVLSSAYSFLKRAIYFATAIES
jgi:hypothetical protein